MNKRTIADYIDRLAERVDVVGADFDGAMWNEDTYQDYELEIKEIEAHITSAQHALENLAIKMRRDAQAEQNAIAAVMEGVARHV